MKRYYSSLKVWSPSASECTHFFNVCKTMNHIREAQGKLLTTAHIADPVIATQFLKLLTASNCGSLSYAQQVFDHIPIRDAFLYNTMITAYEQASSSRIAFQMFRSMVRISSLLPNQYTFFYLFKACIESSGGVWMGEQVRANAIKVGFESNLYVRNALIEMYTGLGLIDDARNVFNGCVEKDLYSWNLMISGYIASGSTRLAKQLFDEMPAPDVVSWSTLISGYVQAGRYLEALNHFHDMLRLSVKPNHFTLTSALAACANLVAIDQGIWIHVYIERNNITLDGKLLAGQIDMYAKCGDIDLASKVFQKYGSKKDVWPWNALLGGFSIHGKSEQAIELFEKMKIANINPNNITFVSLLSACSHCSMVEEGRCYFHEMSNVYGIPPELEHYGCMVDLYGRAGLLKEAEEVILSMPFAPDVAVWGALLGACRIHKDIERGRRIGNMIKELDSDHVGCDVLLSNMYSSFGDWTEAKIVRKEMESSRQMKIPGCSSIELNGIFHQFLVGDRSHPQTKQLYAFLDEIIVKIKAAGYVPEFDELLLDIDGEEDMESALWKHSEKLAVAFGLMNTRPCTPIRIVKNLRVCKDCHQAVKFISKVYDREIVVRDRIRFHHFRDGSCSCKDYW